MSDECCHPTPYPVCVLLSVKQSVRQLKVGTSFSVSKMSECYHPTPTNAPTHVRPFVSQPVCKSTDSATNLIVSKWVSAATVPLTPILCVSFCQVNQVVSQWIELYCVQLLSWININKLWKSTSQHVINLVYPVHSRVGWQSTFVKNQQHLQYWR